jgi:hypothetical protein
MKMGDPLEQSQQLLEELVKTASDLPDYHADLGRTYIVLARLATKAGASPVALLEKAIAALRLAVEMSPENVHYRRALQDAEADHAAVSR